MFILVLFHLLVSCRVVSCRVVSFRVVPCFSKYARTEPCGTPQLFPSNSDDFSLNEAYCLRSVRYDLNQFSSLPFIVFKFTE